MGCQKKIEEKEKKIEKKEDEITKEERKIKSLKKRIEDIRSNLNNYKDKRTVKITEFMIGGANDKIRKSKTKIFKKENEIKALKRDVKWLNKRKK